MAKAIKDTKLSGDLIANPDIIWSAEALPNAGTKNSADFKLGQTMAGVEIKVVAVAGATLIGALTIELQTSSEKATGYVTQVATSLIATTVIAAGDEIARLILPREIVDQLYSVVKLTTTAADQAITVDAYPVFVS
jgi:hypothetical protein